MGLFKFLVESFVEDVQNNNAANDELVDKMSNSPLMNLIINKLLSLDENSFVHIQQDVKDRRLRTVIVGSDFFQIKWSTHHMEQYMDSNGNVKAKNVEDIIEQVSYSFSASGYQPLSSYQCSNGRTVSEKKVIKTFAEVVLTKMKETFPNYTFEYEFVEKTYSDDRLGYKFTYYVPEQVYKSSF